MFELFLQEMGAERGKKASSENRFPAPKKIEN
jgi:hypothetical protein